MKWVKKARGLGVMNGSLYGNGRSGFGVCSCEYSSLKSVGLGNGPFGSRYLPLV